MIISREEAFVLIKKYLKDPDNIKFSLSVEAVLKKLAKKLFGDKELWALAGLLHNLDYEYTVREPEKRGTLSAQLLEGLLPDEVINAIKANNYTHTDYIPTTTLDKSLIAVNSICRLIFTTAQTTPSKKINEVDLNLLINKYRDKSFAATINRSRIEICADLGLEMEDFFELSLETLKDISEKIKI
jgi:predicted hydrolase (HD superfamily)